MLYDKIYNACELAINEVGYEANDGKKNKYAEFLDSIKYFKTDVNGYDWCTSFVNYCYVVSYGIEVVHDLLGIEIGEYNNNASCTLAVSNYSNNGQLFDKPEIGDQMFRHLVTTEPEVYQHTGIVIYADDNVFRTVEGNVGGGNGKVAVRSYSYLNNNYTFQFGRPKWEILEKAKTELDYAKEYMIKTKLFIGDENGDMNWNRVCTREELALVLYRLSKIK